MAYRFTSCLYRMMPETWVDTGLHVVAGLWHSMRPWGEAVWSAPPHCPVLEGCRVLNNANRLCQQHRASQALSWSSTPCCYPAISEMGERGCTLGWLRRASPVASPVFLLKSAVEVATANAAANFVAYAPKRQSTLSA